MATLNPAIRESLERVIADEQLSFSRRVAAIRVGASALAVIATFAVPTAENLRPSHIGTFLYAGTAVTLWLVLRRFPRFARYAGISIAVVDIPMIVSIQVMQQGVLADKVGVVPSGAAALMGLVALSTLSLSRTSVIATAVSALVGMLIEMNVAAMLPVARTMPIIAVMVAAVIGVLLVGRMRSLVHLSRQRDLLGKYVLGERIGIGGMAEVFDATYSPEGGFERRVAVKRILPTLADRPDAVELFRREAQLGATLAHPNIVQVLDFGADGRTYFLAMEYVDGTSLDKLLSYALEAREPLPLCACTYVAWQLSEALDYIHQRRAPSGTPMALVHRDINPPNVLISRDGEVKLADFGIARAVDAEGSTRTGMVRGKLAYMSPEQLRGEPYDARADLFALGATLYEVFTGARLFSGTSDVAIIQAALERTVGPPSAMRPELAEPLDALVLGLLERDVARRTPAALRVREVLWTLAKPIVDLPEGRRALSKLVGRVRAEAGPVPGEATAPAKASSPEAATRELPTRVTP